MSFKINPLRLLFLVMLLTAVPYLFSQSGDNPAGKDKPFIIDKLNGHLDFNGIPDEEVWETVEPFKMVMHSPVFGKDPSEKTEVRIAYDNQYLYAAAILYCSDATIIRSASYKRDFMGAGSDLFGIFLTPTTTMRTPCHSALLPMDSGMMQ